MAAGGRAPLSATKHLQLDPPAPPTRQEIRRPPPALPPPMPRRGSTNSQPRPGFAAPHGPSSWLSTQTLPHSHSHTGPHLTLESFPILTWVISQLEQHLLQEAFQDPTSSQP